MINISMMHENYQEKFRWIKMAEKFTLNFEVIDAITVKGKNSENC